MTKDYAIIIIDAQKGFTSHYGTLALHYGSLEMSGIRTALANLCSFLDSIPSETQRIFVRSEYKRGKFTSGNLGHPLANLCVTNANNDVEWADGIRPRQCDRVITKHELNAMYSTEYREIRKSTTAQGKRLLIFGGFTLTTCVQQTVRNTQKWLGDNDVQCCIALDLTGARLSYFKKAGTAVAPIETLKQELKQSHIRVVGSVWELLEGKFNA